MGRLIPESYRPSKLILELEEIQKQQEILQKKVDRIIMILRCLDAAETEDEQKVLVMRGET